MPKSHWLLSSTALVGLIAQPLSAADLEYTPPLPGPKPAVSELNSKFDVRWNNMFGVDSVAAVGSVSIPLSFSWGAQFDGMIGSIDGDLAAGGGAHLFWRDPDKALVGLYGEYAHASADGAGDQTRVALETEFYFDQFILAGLAGYQFGDLGDGFFSKTSLSYFPDDNLRLYVQHKYVPGDVEHIGAVGGEWLMPVHDNSVSLFGEASFTDDDVGGQVGVRIYFGPQKPLINRVREDDPGDHFDLFMAAAADGVSNKDNDKDVIEE